MWLGSICCLTCCKKRKNLGPNFLKGYVALVEPINFIEERRKRKPFVAAFALITLEILDNLAKDDIIKNVGPYSKLFVKLLAMTSYSLGYFTLVSCIHIRSLCTCILGLIYIILYLHINAFEIYNVYQKELLPEEILDKIFMRILIILTSGTFLVYWFCKQIYKLIKYGQHENEIATKYQIKYVKKLLQPKIKYLNDISNETKASKMKEFGKKRVYSSVRGFRYSLSILISCTVGFIMVSKIGFTLIFKFSKKLYEVRAIMKEFEMLKNITLPNIVEMFVQILHHSKATNSKEINTFDLVYTQLKLIYVSIVLANTLALVLNILNICHELKSYQENVINLARRKQEQNIMNIKNTSNVSLVLSAIRFTGYQVSFFFFGFTLQMVFLGFVFLVVGELTVLPMQFAMEGFFEWIGSLIGPFLLVVLLTKVSQFLLVKFVFLEDKGETMAITNRRGFSIMMYIVFFYNVLTGFMSCLLRVVKGAVLGLILLPRLDRSVYPRTFENYDSAFKSYTCLLRLEALQTNPILVSFIYVLQSIYKESEKFSEINESNGKIDETEQETDTIILPRNINKNAKIRWLVAYTLICNPVLVYERKLFLLKNPHTAQDTENFIATQV